MYMTAVHVVNTTTILYDFHSDIYLVLTKALIIISIGNGTKINIQYHYQSFSAILTCGAKKRHDDDGRTCFICNRFRVISVPK